jgi:hypothetical protein
MEHEHADSSRPGLAEGLRNEPASAEPFSAHVAPDAEGGWLTVILLHDGASVSKWFEDEDAARRYPIELEAWLQRKRSAER